MNLSSILYIGLLFYRYLSRPLSVEVRDSANYFNHPLSCSGPCMKNEQNVKETLQKYEHVSLRSKASLEQPLE